MAGTNVTGAQTVAQAEVRAAAQTRAAAEMQAAGQTPTAAEVQAAGQTPTAAPAPDAAQPGGTVRLTVGQAVVRFLGQQYSERDGQEQRFIRGVVGIFGHGNVCGLGQALLQNEIAPAAGENRLEYFLGRNEQGAVHIGSAYAKTAKRLATLAATSSIGPGATNMVTGAALATTNRLPVLLLPSDSFATRVADPVLQQLELPHNPDISVNDALAPVSRFWARVDRPEQLPAALLGALRVLTDPAETGAATICLPQDVQAEAFDWPRELFAKRVWHIARPPAEPAQLERAAEAIRQAKRPLVIAGGGVVYSQADAALRVFAAATGIPVADTQAGKGAINWDHPQSVGGVGATGSQAANQLAAEADLVIGVGTRYSDFTTASRTQFQNPQVRFVNINLASFDAAKQAGLMVLGDAREALTALTERLAGHQVAPAYAQAIQRRRQAWAEVTDRCYHLGHGPLPAQTEVFGALNDLMGENSIVINAAGSMPGDLQALWRASSSRAYHVEYAYSCMGYEIPAALGAKWAAPEAEVVAIVGDGTYQMLPMELATIVQEGVHVVFVLLQNHGFASIGALSESHGSQRFGTKYLKRNPATGRLDGPPTQVDIAANAASWGLRVIQVQTIAEFRAAYREATRQPGPVMIHIETDLLGPNPPSNSWWDVPVAQVSDLASTQTALGEYRAAKTRQRPLM
ncbi:MAG: 3D-(3,5/4)-trihydroxycyclohexane-1,2-dione acylhydrolase (decyclizing) [Bifidobacteriaceae bacterium]|jgi:3D-(3,5/4)-trihydroxycyclohexane-1,2-dione acylhydrolase (decyclizing)|nr:3D-(3,5/4)-trihydroxycyclohexane-1,2-dione acylhydrolase (decyclizing) [Bifidobacteriaceae bacterium]